MKYYLLFLLFFVDVGIALAQDSSKMHVRNVIWSTPVKKNTIINGVALGFSATPWMGAASIKVNGLNVEISLFGMIGGLYGMGGTIASLRFKKTDTLQYGAKALISRYYFPEQDYDTRTTINGISLSFGGVTEGNIRGLSINGFSSFANQMFGVEITGITNLHYEFRGIMVAGLRNKVTKANGLQIGLINTCKTGSVVQLGLINRIGDRITPIINFKFKK